MALDPVFLTRLILTTLDGAPFPHIARSTAVLLGTCAVESGFRPIAQIGGGPALGIFQIETNTAKDHQRYIDAHHPLQDCVRERSGVLRYSAAALQHNLLYGIFLARVQYLVRDPFSMPEVDHPEHGATRWADYYNTKGNPQPYFDAWDDFIVPVWDQVRAILNTVKDTK